MSNCAEYTGIFGGLTTGFIVAPYLKASAGVIAGSAGAGVVLLTLVPGFMSLVPLYYLGKQIRGSYTDNPFKLMSSYFLLMTSFAILNTAISTAIFAAFLSTVNPFTLPILIAAGASACVVLGLYLLTRPGGLPSLSQGFAKCFNQCIPKNWQPVHTTNLAHEEHSDEESEYNDLPPLVSIDSNC